jgi:hypothetical protein
VVFQGLLGLSEAEIRQLESDEVSGEAYVARLAQEGQ